MRKLIYVSNNAINKAGKEHAFFLQEKSVLLNKFGEFNVVCPNGIYFCNKKGETNCKYQVKTIDKIIAAIKALNCDFVSEIKHMLKDKKFSFTFLAKLYLFTKRGMQMERLIRKSMSREEKKDICLYSFWITYDAYAVARIKRDYPECYAVARAHSFDLQISKNAVNPYLMKKCICNNFDKIAFISENILNEFLDYYKEKQSNFVVQYLGSIGAHCKYIARAKHETLTILSCSSIIPVKQLNVIIDALSNWEKCKVKWIHIGDGAQRDEIKELAKNKLSKLTNVEYEFAGFMRNTEVLKYLCRNDIDVFVNSSKVEGVPVSIMEAMSFGIPVIAPAINGIPELVKPGSGFLFDVDGGGAALKAELEEFADLSEEAVLKMGESAHRIWKEEFCLENNDEVLFKDV